MCRKSDMTRAIWADITANPQITLRALAERHGRGSTTVRYHLQKLERLGYVRGAGRNRGYVRTVMVPLYSAYQQRGDL